MPREKLTVKRIALLAGVSIGTVDRVLHERGGVSDSTKKMIEAIVREGDYRPNIMARQLALGKDWRFHVVMPLERQDSEYWGLCRAGVEKAIETLAAYRVSVSIHYFDRYDAGSCRDLLARIAENPGNGLLLAPVLPAEFSAFLANLDPSVPYAFFDGWIEGLAPRFSIYQDAWKSGYLAGKILCLLAPRGTLAAVNAHGEDIHIGHRIEGFRAALADRGRKAIVADCRRAEDPVSRNTFMRELFSLGDGIEGILVVNSAGHYFGHWLAEKGQKHGCALVSWDLVPENFRALREGRIDCVISQRPEEQTRMGLELLFRTAALAAVPEGPRWLPIDVFFKENAPCPELHGETGSEMETGPQEERS